MNYPWQNSQYFPFNESLACCCEPGCPSALIIPVGVLYDPINFPPYADSTAAQAALDDEVVDCSMWVEAGIDITTKTIAVGTGIDIALVSTTVQRGTAWISVNLTIGDTLGYNLAVTTNGTNPGRPAFVSISLYSCTGEQQLESANNTGTETSASMSGSFGVPASGEYLIRVEGGGAGDATEFDFTAGLTFTDTFSVNPVKAAYGDPVQLLDC